MQSKVIARHIFGSLFSSFHIYGVIFPISLVYSLFNFLNHYLPLNTTPHNRHSRGPCLSLPTHFVIIPINDHFDPNQRANKPSHSTKIHTSVYPTLTANLSTNIISYTPIKYQTTNYYTQRLDYLPTVSHYTNTSK